MTNSALTKLQPGDVHILKPGIQPDVIKASKTNLQLRELQMMQACLRECGILANIMTTTELLQHSHQLTGHAFMVFNSAKCFDDELYKILSCIALIPNCKLILVSNDCRLSFSLLNNNVWRKLLERYLNKHDIDIVCITNATKNLLDYMSVVLPEADNFIPAMHLPLDTLPCMITNSQKTDKTTDFVYTCMHYCDYDDYRQQALTLLAEQFGDRLTIYGDIAGLQANDKPVESAGVVDANNTAACYSKAKISFVLLELNYDRFGVMPNRLAEAAMNNCVSVILTNGHADCYDAFKTATNNIDDCMLLADSLANDSNLLLNYSNEQFSLIKQRHSMLLHGLSRLLAKYRLYNYSFEHNV